MILMTGIIKGYEMRIKALTVTYLLILINLGIAQSWVSVSDTFAVPLRICADSTGQKIILSITRGGSWHTYNGGLSWEAIEVIDNPVTGFSGSSFLTLDSESDTVIAQFYSNTFEFSRFYSFDSGTNWEIVNQEFSTVSSHQFTFDESAKNRWYAVDMWRTNISEDYGQSWEVYENDDRIWQKSQLSIDQNNTDILYYSGFYGHHPEDGYSNRGGLVKSDDRGQTWDHYNPLLNLFDEFNVNQAFINSFLQTGNGDFLVSISNLDNSNPWYNSNIVIIDSTGIPYGRFGEELGIRFQPQEFIEDISIPGRIYTYSGNYYHFYVSDDYGRTWNRIIGNGLPNGWLSISDIFQNRFSGDLYVVIQNEGVFKSQDHGDSWERILLPSVGSGTTLFNVIDDYIYSLDLTGTRQIRAEITTGFSEILSFPTNEDTLIIPRRVYHVNGDTIVSRITKFSRRVGDDIEWSGDFFIYSSDGGITWEENPNVPQKMVSFYNTITYDNNTRITGKKRGTESDTVCITYDLGRNWDKIPFVLTNSNYFFSQTENGVYFSDISDIYKLDIQNENISGLDYPGQALVGNSVWTNFGDSLLTVSDDGECYFYDGFNWERKANVQGERHYGITLIPGDVYTFVAMVEDHNGFYLSQDFGDNWEYLPLEFENSDQNTWLTYIEYDEDRHRLWVATGLGVMWLDAEEVASGVKPVSLHPIESKLLSCYPNPFNSSANITYQVTKPGKVELKLFDITGRLVKECIDSQHEIGSFSFLLNMEGFSSGTYFVKYISDQDVHVQKISLVK